MIRTTTDAIRYRPPLWIESIILLRAWPRVLLFVISLSLAQTSSTAAPIWPKRATMARMSHGSCLLERMSHFWLAIRLSPRASSPFSHAREISESLSVLHWIDHGVPLPFSALISLVLSVPDSLSGGWTVVVANLT